MIYLLDTDTVIFMIRGRKITVPKTPSQRRLREGASRARARCVACQQQGDQLGISVITVAELEFGARLSEDYENEAAAIELILRPFIAFDFKVPESARHYGKIRYDLERSGRPTGAMDLLIGSHARALNAALVTNKVAHFSSIPDLRCENWVQ